MKNDILVTNESLRLNIGLFLLFCFALPAPVNVGIESFITMPLDVSVIQIFDEGTRFIVGYIIAVIFMIFLSGYIVWAARVVIIAILLLTIVMFLPLSPLPMAIVYCLQNLCNIFIMGLELSIVINLFSKGTAIKAMSLVYVFSAIVLVMLDAEIPVSFTTFRVWAMVSSVCWLYFYCKLPATVWPRYIRKADGIVPPHLLFIGVYFLLVLSGIFTFLGEAVVMSVSGGFSIFYLSSIPAAIALYLLWRRVGINPFKIGAVLVSLGTLGLAGVVVSTYIPALAIPSCILIGTGTVIFGLVSYYGGVFLAKRYPSRFIVPLVIFFSFIPLGAYYMITTALQDNIQFLYAICLLIAIILTIMYLILAPYMSYSLNEKPLSTHAGTDIVLSEKTNSLSENAFDKLSGQELRLAELIMQGYTHKEIMDILKISDNTVRGYRKSLYSKLQVHSRKELFELAEKSKLQ